MAHNEYFTISEFSSISTLSRMTLHRRIADGTIPSIKVGRRRLIPADALNHLLKSPKVAQEDRDE